MKQMKRLNNKGFAITTLLYGLMSVGFLVMTLLMGIMSQNRQNTSTLVKKIEEELNRYGETETTFAYLGEAQEYIVPYGQAGWYKIELWGAKSSGVNGDYTSGVIYLAENAKLYFYLGNTCANATACGTAFNRGNTEVRIDTATETSVIMRASGYGKTSYIAGYAGDNSLSQAGASTYQTEHWTGKYFINGLKVKEVNDGYGKANIELVSKTGSNQYPSMKTFKFSQVRYIRHCMNGSNGAGTNQLVEIQAINIVNGKNVAKGKTATNVTNTAYITDGVLGNNHGIVSGCTQIDLGAVYNLSEIAVWHYYATANRSYYNNTIEVSTNGSTWQFIKNKSSDHSTSVIATELGEHYTPWQADPIEMLPSGSYYIFSITNQNKVLTAQNAREVIAPSKPNALMDVFKGEKLQKWTIEKVSPTDTNISNKAGWTSHGIYRVYESENNHALQIAEGTNEIGENLNVDKPVRNYEWDLWNIISLSNGTYKLKSLISGPGIGSNERFMYEQDSGNVVSYTDTTSDASYNTRFRIINAEY